MKLLRFSTFLIILTLVAGDVLANGGLANQGHYRWRIDDGSETTATWMTLEDSPTIVGPGYNFRLRTEIWNNSGSQYNATLKLVYSTNTGGPWTDITTDGSSNAFKIVLSANFNDGDPVTGQLTDTAPTTHTGGQMFESSTTFVISIDNLASLEYEWCLQATANAVHTTTYYFSIIGSTGVPLSQYDRYPTLSYDQALPVVLATFTANQQGKNVILSWTTACETDNLGFILERRANGAPWQTVASYQTDAALKGQGNATTNTRYSFIDTQAPENTSCEYRLSDVDIHGKAEQIGSVQVTVNSVPTAFVLEATYPNPFNPSTNIRYHLAQNGLVKLTVLDMLGRAVKTIDNAWLPAGTYTRAWNAVNDNNLPVPSGVYFFRLETTGVNLVQKAVLIR